MPTLGGVNVWVQVDGLRVPEHRTLFDRNKTHVTCFIPSTEGKRFTVHFENVAREDIDVAGYVYIDSLFMDGKLLLASRNRESVQISGRSKAAGKECPFKFAKLKLTG
ncbi:hypothetical protein SISSUDRAFT_113674 [Sistotremastrum suecicum HHB10207 ss-3]|uniref:DUF7918 domain-containing protein n=1 Tax=Sistotremastrum suecicum HHB10207 ss-3 TaxID=1314776 RepID=A0A166H0R7_9AGAM|nr:hypothetical protein SISSUDRAFT_113674 [Sistotremastrum suecicum HHB10207 ss-3]